jgi:LmbE family N-acetylglucosaminyl deacetylase
MVREFAPHVILTHRTCDYHADHRACSQLVQDMTYLLGIPNWCPDTPPPAVLRPAVFFMSDHFDFPRPLRADAVVAVDDVLDRCHDAMACHASQFLEFLPVDMGLDASEVPDRSDTAAVRRFMHKWFTPMKKSDAVRFRDRVVEWYGDSSVPENVEVFEMSRYGRQLTESDLRELFRM